MTGQRHFSTKTMKWERCTATKTNCGYAHISEQHYKMADPQALSAFFFANNPGVRQAAESTTTRRGGRANVDEAERKMKSLITLVASGDEQAANELSRTIANLPENNQFRLLRGQDAATIREVADNCVARVRELTGEESPVLSASSNNRFGSDIEEQVTGSSFELKFGAATDVNVGVSKLTDCFHTDLAAVLPSDEDRKQWRQQYTEGKLAGHNEAMGEKLAGAALALSDDLGKELSPAGQQRLNAYYVGISSDNEIQTADASREVTRLCLGADADWSVHTRPGLDPEKSWSLTKVEYSDGNRLNLRFSHGGGATMRFTYNFKNSYVLPDGTKADAKLGLGSPSWNGWVKES